MVITGGFALLKKFCFLSVKHRFKSDSLSLFGKLILETRFHVLTAILNVSTGVKKSVIVSQLEFRAAFHFRVIYGTGSTRWS